ncbi:hypothetical protein A374_18034 [Fictibacillus macauensis ZFHKF-1]|uniref:Uncharacterized protein n=1 Tax=Fictibacillus macauensis ZFHKF-1 TaxID=1196324 RepID=I8UAM3_9BACL|nr:hypothetical protein [Fictibacillus macauensis]EIT83960.1 hypothetical protein A374_18034 [Fictibacillus macauensis ZFHKF-1]
MYHSTKERIFLVSKLLLILYIGLRGWMWYLYSSSNNKYVFFSATFHADLSKVGYIVDLMVLLIIIVFLLWYARTIKRVVVTVFFILFFFIYLVVGFVGQSFFIDGYLLQTKETHGMYLATNFSYDSPTHGHGNSVLVCTVYKKVWGFVYKVQKRHELDISERSPTTAKFLKKDYTVSDHGKKIRFGTFAIPLK